MDKHSKNVKTAKEKEILLAKEENAKSVKARKFSKKIL